MLLNNSQYNYVCNRVYSELKFCPSCEYRGHSFNARLPFEIKKPHIVYAIENMTDEQCNIMDDIISNCFIEVTNENERIYALDWEHAGFICNPRNPNDWQSKDCFFPWFYPDGDYYFFISEDFRFGYLGHPWRQEVWIFGTDLINAISGKTHILGWTELKRNMI